MNLIHGKIVVSQQQRDIALEHLEESIMRTLQQNKPLTEAVLNACDELSRAVGDKHIALLESIGISCEKAKEYVSQAKTLLRKESLFARMKMELGDKFSFQTPYAVKENGIVIQERIMPLGTLFHIAAGNQYGLAFYSVIEGLLTGNINIVKLPSGDDGLSAMVLSELIKIEPLLNEYIYLFDYTSKDIDALQKMMNLANAVVVWGGDQAIQAVRQMAGPDTKIIEWGHRLSFAYVTPSGMQDELLTGLAHNIVQTNQLLCSSCQGIYIDTVSMEEVYRFCEKFFPILEQYAQTYGEEPLLEIQAQTGLQVYTERLQPNSRPCRVFQGRRTSLLAYEDSRLRTSILYGNVWIKRLPRENLLHILRTNKGYLQTAALLCEEQERDMLTDLLWNAGVMRVTQGKNMSHMYSGAAHDGEYTLRRYTRVVSQEFIEEPNARNV
ncbi:hypothetical protein LJB83_01940 [Clostridia bacterium OttesenSCG-928-F22]|nr:hypothetical protein [Clostridia bacterium OttesenSCG-928-F22]